MSKAITGSFENPADAAALAAIEAAEAAGLDPFGDDDASDAAPAEAVAEVSNNGDEDLGDDLGDAAEGADNVAADAAPAVSADQLDAILSDETAKPFKFKADTPDGYETKIADLDAKEAKAFKEMMDGTIDSDAYLAVKSEVSRETRKLERELARSETLAEVNTQNEATQQQTALANTMANAKKAGLDYGADHKAVKQFNAALEAIAADPDNANKPPSEIYAQANGVVLALRGIAKPAAGAQAQGKPEPRKAEPAPVTLRDIPAAVMPNTGGGVAEHLSRLGGVDFEAAFDKLTPAQQAALLDS